MKTLLLFCLFFSAANASASEKAFELYDILKQAGIPEAGAGVLLMSQEKVVGIFCRKKQASYSCGLDRDDSSGNMIRVSGENGKKLYDLLAPSELSCGAESCGFFIDAVQCGYSLDTANQRMPMSARTHCSVMSTKEI